MKNLIGLIFLSFTLFGCSFSDEVESNGLISLEEASSFLTIESISPPQDGTYGVAATLDFEVTFSEETNVSGNPCIPLIIGAANRTACYTSGSGSAVLIFSHIILLGDNDTDGIQAGNSLSLNGGNFTSTKLQNNLDISNIKPSLTNIRVDTSFLPPDQVTSVNQTNLSVDRTQVFFNWAAPNDNGTPITHYVIRYKISGANSYSYLSPDPVTTTTDISGLISGNVYDIQVAASNGAIGAFSSTLNISTVFDPKSLGALVWFEAKDINGDGSVVADGTSITTIVDKSGKGNNAAKLPTGTAGTIETVDDKKVLRLGASGYRTITSLGEAANTDIEVYVVAKTRAITSSFAFVNENEGNPNRFGAHFPWSDFQVYIDLPLGNRIQGNWGGNTSDFFAWTFRSSTTQGKALERNGSPVLNSGNRTITPPLKAWTIGSNYNGTNALWQADLQSFFIFDKILDAQQRTDFFQYIEDEYGVTMN